MDAKRSLMKSFQVCKEVTTLQCNVIGYTECTMTMEALPYKGHKMVPKFFQRKKCREEMKTEIHKKKKSECKDVTKQNCVTKWEVLPSGEKVFFHFSNKCNNSSTVKP